MQDKWPTVSHSKWPPNFSCNRADLQILPFLHPEHNHRWTTLLSLWWIICSDPLCGQACAEPLALAHHPLKMFVRAAIDRVSIHSNTLGKNLRSFLPCYVGASIFYKVHRHGLKWVNKKIIVSRTGIDWKSCFYMKSHHHCSLDILKRLSHRQYGRDESASKLCHLFQLFHRSTLVSNLKCIPAFWIPRYHTVCDWNEMKLN